LLWLHCSLLCTIAVSKHLSGSGAKLPNRQGEAALGFQNFRCPSLLWNHPPSSRRNGVVQLVYGMERTHNIAALHMHGLMARVEGDDCRLSRNHHGGIATRGLARCICSPPLLTNLRRAVLNPTDLYSVSFVNKGGYRDAQCRLGSFSPAQYRFAHRRRSGGDEQSAVSTVCGK